MSRAYYNDSEPFVCDWLRNLIAAGHLPAGKVDSRPIQEVTPDDVRAFTQCHFFAGIGGWAYALRLAGWPIDRRVWTGSCPCQPFSAAGKRGGTGDVRHLWPSWADLIRECRPPTVFGEQVASSDGVAWFDAVSGDLEGMGYAVGAADLSAAGVGAPHLRQRLWFVADANHTRPQGRRRTELSKCPDQRATGSSRPLGELAHADGGEPGDGDLQRGGQHGQQPQDSGAGGTVADADHDGWHRPPGDSPEPHGDRQDRRIHRGGSAPWIATEWLPCRDGKARPVEPGTFPLAHGIPGRVGRLRAYGNAIVPAVAAAFVSAYLEVAP